MEEIFTEVSNGRGRVNFEQFIRFMVELYEDKSTPDQVRLAFRDVAEGKVCHVLDADVAVRDGIGFETISYSRCVD